MRPRIVIIGGGPAGYEAALVACDLGADVIIVSNEGLGGNCVLWDCVPSKALIVAAEARATVEVAAQIGSATDAGIAEAVDYGKLARHVLGLGAEQSRDIEKRINALQVSIITGIGAITGEHEVTVTADDGSTTVLPADYVLIATGSRPRVLPFFVPDSDRVLVGSQVYQVTELPEHLIVVGSGATGAEFAHAFKHLGSKVTLVSSRDRILPTEDPDAAEVIERVFERRGMTIVRESRAVACGRDEDSVTVTLDSGVDIVGSHVLFTVGQVPAADGLGLEPFGVTHDAGGFVTVDAVGRTSCPWIYAAGDVTGRMMLASVAAMQGRTAMWHALGEAVQPIRWDAVAATVFTGPEVATVGMSARDAEANGLPIDTARLDFKANPRAKMIDALDGFVKVHAMVGSGTVLGGVIVSRRASELIQPLALAVQHRLTVSQLAQTITVYPSMTGSVAEAARMLMVRLDTNRSDA
ncbi:MAG: NAD(P)H-quinone dehydrogenase [Nitriliruptoraceae bacterium]